VNDVRGVLRALDDEGRTAGSELEVWVVETFMVTCVKAEASSLFVHLVLITSRTLRYREVQFLARVDVLLNR